MLKIIFPFLLVLGCLFVYPYMYGEVEAITELMVSPQRFSNLDTSGVDVRATNLVAGKDHSITIEYTAGEDLLTNIGVNRQPNASLEISFHLCSSNPGSAGLGKYRIADDCNGKVFQEGDYTLKIYEGISTSNRVLLATSTFNVFVQTSGLIEFLNDRFTTGEDIRIKVTGIPNGSYKIWVDNKDTDSGISCLDLRDGSEINLGKYREGDHRIMIFTNQAGTIRHPFCGEGREVTRGNFTVDNATGGHGGGVGIGTTSPASIIIKQCKSKDDPDFDTRYDMVCALSGGIPCGTDPSNPGIATAIGCIHTNPTELVKDLMKFAVGIGGGLAFLMMLLGAFQMLSSSGNPETLNAGKERLTSAMIGLLFVIFAVLLLQIIGVDILAIPGFGK